MKKLAQKVFSSRFGLPLACVVYVAVFFLIYGWYLPISSYLIALHAHPFVRLPAIAQYLNGSMLGPVIGHYLGAAGYLSTRIFYGVVVVLCLVALYLFTHRIAQGNVRTHIVLLALLTLTPLLHVLFSWIGKSDPLLILAFLGFLYFDSRIVKNGMVFFMFLAHREMAFFMLVLWVLLYRPKWRDIKVLLPGAVTAVFWFAIYTALIGDYNNRVAYVIQHTGLIIQSAVNGFPLIIMLAFSWFWVVLGALLWKDRENRFRITLSILLVIGLSFITLDHVRVAITIAVPLVLFALERVMALGWAEELFSALPLILLFGLCQVEYDSSRIAASNWPLIIKAHPGILAKLRALF